MARLDMRRSAEGGGDRRDYGDEQNYSSDAESSSQESHRNRLQRPLAFLASDTDSNIRPDLAMAGYELPSCAHSGMNANQSDMMGDSHLFTHELPRVQSAERADDVHLRDGKEHPASGDFNDSLPRRHALRSCNSANGSDIVSSASTSFAIEESVHVERSPTAIMIEKMQRTVAGNSGTGNGVGFAGIEVSSGHAIARSGVLPPLPAALSAGTYTAALGEERVRRRDQFK